VAANVVTSQTTVSTTYVDLATVGPTVTLTVPASGRVLVSVTSDMSNSTGGGSNFMGFAISGADTRAAADTNALILGGNTLQAATASFIVTGLTANGSDTFTAKYRVSGGTGTFSNRSIWAIPIP
jgi:hypothetical protein